MSDKMSAESIFDGARNKPSPEARAAYLDSACGENVELRQRVEQLLAANAAAGSFLESPVQQAEGATRDFVGQVATHSEMAAEQVGSQIGPYRLVQLLGEGGMGSVWMAQQSEPVKRLVAIKLIKTGMDSKQVLARFEAERQALALMDHPSIAKVLDAGATATGRPYFVMELVKGVPITKYCDEHRLTPRQRLELFVPVCQAIQHAHQKGIIHRDIKPSNVMIALYDDRPVPKVIDFGVAKATGQALTEQTLTTEFGGIVGTPEYMSPEQASLNNLDIDTRSDIYSLGVLLYELLAGSPPFKHKDLEKAGLLEMLRVIREVDPPKPSTKLSTADALPSLSANRSTEPKKLTGLLRNELDWIVMKALEKDRARRYETANGFAADINRYLSGEPVNAHPPSSVYRTKKFLRKHKGPVIAVAAVTVALLVGVVGFAWQARIAQHQRDRAEDEKQIAQAVRNFLAKDLLEQASAWKQANAILIAGGRQSEAAANPTIKDLLNRAATELTPDKIEQKFPNQPLVQAEILKTVGDTYLAVGAYDLAITHLHRSRDLFLATLGPDSLETLKSMDGLALAYDYAGKFDLAQPLSQDTLKLMKAKLGPNHPATLECMGNLAICYQHASNYDLALPLFEETLKLQKATLGPEHHDTLTGMGKLASAYHEIGKFDLAMPLFDKTFKLMTSKLGPDHPDTLTAMSALASSYRAAGRIDLALPLYDQSLKRDKVKFGLDHPQTLRSMQNNAGAYREAGRIDLAVSLQATALKLTKDKLGPDHPDTLKCMNYLALVYLDAGRLDLSLPLSTEALTLAKAKFGADHEDTFDFMDTLAACYLVAAKHDRSLPLFEEAHRWRKEMLGPDHPQTLKGMIALAGGYQAAGKHDLATPLFRESLKLLTAKFGPDHPETLGCMLELANGYLATGKPKLALPMLTETHNLSKAKLGADHPATIASMGALALGYKMIGKEELAMQLFKDALEISTVKRGRDHPYTIDCIAHVGSCYRDAKKFDLALPLYEEAFKLAKAKFGADYPKTLTIMNNLAMCYYDSGKLDLALPLFDESLKLKKVVLGEDHPDTLAGMQNLGGMYLMAGKVDVAIPLMQETLKLAKAKLGPEDPQTLACMNSLGWCYKEAGDFDLALPLITEAVRGFKAAFGTDHPRTNHFMYNLAKTYVVAGRGEESLPYVEDYLVSERKRSGADSPQFAATLAQFSLDLLKCRQFNAAEKYLRECLAIREKKEADVWTTFNTKSLLGDSLLGQKKYADAEPLLIAGYEGMKQRVDKMPPQVKQIRLSEALERLIRLHDDLGKPDDGKKWKKELDEVTKATEPPAKPH